VAEIRIGFQAGLHAHREGVVRTTAAVPLTAVKLGFDTERAGAAREPLGDADRTQRRLVEQRADRPERLVRARRLREHEAGIRAAEQRLLQSHQELGDALAGAAVATDAADRLALVEHAHLNRVREHVQRREAVYWQHLLRRHPDYKRIDELLRRPEVGLPSWAYESTDEDHR
jgi:hypothetical protein